MYRVEYRFAGHTVWRAAALPVTLQAAQTIARGVSAPALADEIRVVPSGTARTVDVRA